MTLRGTFREGVIVPDQVNGLRNGDVVEIVTGRNARAKPARRAAVSSGGQKTVRSGTGRKSRTKKAPLFGFGMLKDKPEWRDRSSTDVVRELRTRASRRIRGG